MFAFAVSNGYISTLIMLASVVEPSLEQEEIEVRPIYLSHLDVVLTRQHAGRRDMPRFLPHGGSFSRLLPLVRRARRHLPLQPLRLDSRFYLTQQTLYVALSYCPFTSSQCSSTAFGQSADVPALALPR